MVHVAFFVLRKFLREIIGRQFREQRATILSSTSFHKNHLSLAAGGGLARGKYTSSVSTDNERAWNRLFGTTRVCVQLFRQRFSHKSVKAYATMPIGIKSRKGLALID